MFLGSFCNNILVENWADQKEQGSQTSFAPPPPFSARQQPCHVLVPFYFLFLFFLKGDQVPYIAIAVRSASELALRT